MFGSTLNLLHLCLVNINLKQILGCSLQLMNFFVKRWCVQKVLKRCFLHSFSSLDFLRCAYSLLSKAMLPPVCLPPHSPFSYKSFFLFYATFGLEGSLEPFSKSITFTDISSQAFHCFANKNHPTLWRLEFTKRSFCHCETHTLL
jgi:hypothetical protein